MEVRSTNSLDDSDVDDGSDVDLAGVANALSIAPHQLTSEWQTKSSQQSLETVSSVVDLSDICCLRALGLFLGFVFPEENEVDD
jgi:hypothetical protein